MRSEGIVLEKWVEEHLLCDPADLRSDPGTHIKSQMSPCLQGGDRDLLDGTLTQVQQDSVSSE